MKSICAARLFIILFAAIVDARMQDVGKIVPDYVCPLHFMPVNGKCYFFSLGKTTWQNAYYQCEKYNSTLATPSQNYQDLILRFYLNSTKLANIKAKERWIGGRYDWKQKIWKWAISGQPLEYHGFSRVKPDREFKIKWQCIVLDPKHQYKWNAKNCMSKKHFVCETKTNKVFKKMKCDKESCDATNNEVLNKNERSRNEPATIRQKPVQNRRKPKLYACPPHMILLGNKCYYFSKEEKTSDEAHFACTENRTKLAIIKSRHKDLALRKFLNKNFVESKERWIGGRYDWEQKVWKWAISGEKIKYKGFPKNFNATASNLKWHSIIMDPKLRNRWNSRMDLEKKAFICQAKAQKIQFNGRDKSSSYHKNNQNGRIHLNTYTLQLKSLRNTMGDLKSNIFYYNATTNPLYPRLITEEVNFDDN